MADQIYPKGLRVWPPNENAPDFVKGRISIHLETFVEWAQKNIDDKGYISLDLKDGRDGLYASVNMYKKGSEPTEKRNTDPSPEDAPF